MKKRKSKEERKEEIFLIITQIIYEKGMYNVSTSEVARRLGVTQPAIYKYFKNKDEMILYFLDVLEQKIRQIIEISKTKDDIQDKIKTIYREHLKFIEQTKIIPKVVFSETIHIGNLQKREKLKKIIFYYRKELSDIFSYGIKNKYIKDIEPEIIVNFFIGSLISSYLQWILSDKNYSLSDQAERLFQGFKEAFFTQ